MSQDFQVSTKLQVTSFLYLLKIRNANYELNLKLQFSKTFAESDFETANF